MAGINEMLDIVILQHFMHEQWMRCTYMYLVSLRLNTAISIENSYISRLQAIITTPGCGTSDEV